MLLTPAPTSITASAPATPDSSLAAGLTALATAKGARVDPDRLQPRPGNRGDEGIDHVGRRGDEKDPHHVLLILGRVVVVLCKSSSGILHRHRDLIGHLEPGDS